MIRDVILKSRRQQITPVGVVLARAGLAHLQTAVTYMFNPNHASRSSGNRHYLYRNGVWSDVCPLTAGSMAATGEITGGSQSIFVTGTVESFSVIWNNAGLPVVAFSIGFNRSLTAAERTALSSLAFWASLFAGTAISTAACTALYPYLAPDFQNLVGFWDANSITGLVNNDPVTTWSDKSGLGFHAGQSGAASLKPTYLINQQNGLPQLSYDGGDFLVADTLAAHFTGEDKSCSCVAVLKRANTSGTHYVVSLGRLSNVSPRFIPVGYPNSARVHIFRRDDTEASSAVYELNANTEAAHIVSSVFTGTTIKGYVNGAKQGATTTGDLGAITLNSFTIGAYRTTTVQNAFTGLIGEVLLYKSALSDANRQLIQNYLSAKWGIALA